MGVKGKKYLKIMLIVITMLLLVIAIGAVVIVSQIGASFYDNQIEIVDTSAKKDFSDKELSEEDIEQIGSANDSIYKEQQKDNDIINIVLVGVDARKYEENSRSDTIILLSYNKTEHTVKLISFLRDSWVYLPERGWGKINSATAYGGVGLLVNTLNENFDLDVQHYAQIKFSDFTKVIDILGGIDIELTKSEIDYINMKLHTEDRDYSNDLKASPGMVHLNGVQTLWHCRNRSIGNGDFKRTERQRDVLEILINKALSMRLANMTQLVYELKDYVDMNIPITAILSLGKDALITGDLTIEAHQIPFENAFQFATKQGQSVIELNMDKTVDELHKIVGFESEEDD